jgi:hypothetical protein
MTNFLYVALLCACVTIATVTQAFTTTTGTSVPKKTAAGAGGAAFVSGRRPSTPTFGHILSPLFLAKNTKNNKKSNVPPPPPPPSSQENTLTRVSEEEEGVPIPFLDTSANSFIECYADSVAVLDGIEYTIGVPCDYAVALCYMDNEDLVPVELNDALMDDIFLVAENIVAEEFGEELVLQRTPQTLTLVGELEEEDEDEEDDDDDDDDEDDEELEDGDEEVEVLLSFEHRGKEFNLVRLLDPILLVGKIDAERPGLRVLLTPEESDSVMPLLEELFLEFHEDRDGMMP